MFFTLRQMAQISGLTIFLGFAFLSPLQAQTSLSDPDYNYRITQLEARIAVLEQKLQYLEGTNKAPGQEGPSNGSPATGSEVIQAPALRTSPSNSIPAEEAYDIAYGSTLRGEYDLAENAYKRFIADYPRHQFVGRSWYWLGESYFSRSRYQDAATAFLTSYRDYPKDVKAPNALLMLGVSLKALNQTKAACSSFAKLKSDYPQINPKTKARLAEESASCS